METLAPFDAEVHNHYIENFGISPGLTDVVATAEICITFYKLDANTPTANRFLVNNISFEI